MGHEHGQDVGLEWNPKKSTVVHVRRGVHVSDKKEMILDGMARIPGLEDRKQHKFLGMLESVMKKDKLVLRVCSHGVPPTDVCYLYKFFVRLQLHDCF